MKPSTQPNGAGPAAVEQPPQQHLKYRRLLRRHTVLDITSLSNSGMYQLIADGFFPKPVKPTGGRASAWVEDEVLAYIEARIRDRDAEAPKASKLLPHQANPV